MLTRRAALAAISGIAGLRCPAEGNSAAIQVPARFNGNKQILIPVKVNGSAELWCLLDTGGANILYLRPAKIAELGITPSSVALSSGPLDTGFRAGGRALVTLDVGSVHRTNQELYIKEFASRDDGIIGAAVFDRWIVELDFLTPTVRLHEPASFRYVGDGTVIAFDAWSHNPHIVVSLTIDEQEPVRARMTVDSGAGGTADAFLTPKFNEQLRSLSRQIAWKPDRDGFSTCRIPRLDVGPYFIDDPLVAMPPVQGFAGNVNAPDGMLAVNFLRHYRVYVDYSRTQIILEPNEGSK